MLTNIFYFETKDLWNWGDVGFVLRTVSCFKANWSFASYPNSSLWYINVGIYERYVGIVIELQVDQFLYQLWSI